MTAAASVRERPEWLAEVVDPDEVRFASPLGWGFHNETWRLDLVDGRSVAVTRFADSDRAAEIVSQTALLGPLLSAAGVPSPGVVQIAGRSTPDVLVTEFVEGRTGAEMLGEHGGPAGLGSLLGRAWRRLAAVDVGGLSDAGLDASWAAVPDDLTAATLQRLGRVGQMLAASEAALLNPDLETLPDLLRTGRATFVHGDFVPVNVLVRDERLVALLDLEYARIADPLLDAAWFRCIVGYHHPGDEPLAWRAFVDAAELDTDEPRTSELIRVLPSVRILEILDDAALSANAQEHWLDVLRAWLERPR